MSDVVVSDTWADDLLGFREVGLAYTNLVTSLDDTRVISIEARYGRGKTFFRQAWAAHMRAQGEVVVELDALLSDHSGDPVISFIGALIGALPETKKTLRKQAFDTGKRIAGLAVRTTAKVFLRNAFEEVAEFAAGEVSEHTKDIKALDDTVNELGEGLSKQAGQVIAAQLVSERMRLRELPEQLDSLRKVLTRDRDHDRIVVLIDELDRCHPDFALALMEAMKLVFNRPGFVFCLMINAEYLENLARHRFGAAEEDERYLDKFVDIRLKLPTSDTALSNAVRKKALELPLAIPFGDDPEFTVGRAADLAAELAPISKLSLRQIERVLLRVELALRIYKDRPIDCALLVWLAFQMTCTTEISEKKMSASKFIRRAKLTPTALAKPTQGSKRYIEELNKYVSSSQRFVRENCIELLSLQNDRYKTSIDENRQKHSDWELIVEHLALYYVPEHQAMLDGVLAMEAGTYQDA